MHPYDGCEESEPDNRMPEARCRPAAQNHSDPEQVRRVEGPAGGKTIDVRQRREPMHDALPVRVALNHLAHGSFSTFFGPKRLQGRAPPRIPAPLARLARPSM